MNMVITDDVLEDSAYASEKGVKRLESDLNQALTSQLRVNESTVEEVPTLEG